MLQIKVNSKKECGSLGDLYGIFFEDLNHAADGGLYGEMIQNRGFEYCSIDHDSYHPLFSWEKIEKKGGVLNWSIQNTNPLHIKNPNYLVLDCLKVGEGVGVSNLGYLPGMYFEKNKKYTFSFYGKNDGREGTNVRILLENKENEIIDSKNIFVESSKKWKKYEFIFLAKKTTIYGKLTLYIEGIGRFYFDMFSLFPEETYQGRKNGLRKDIGKMLEELKPKFMRFPGGCLVHDGSLNSDDRDSLYRWKNTIGQIEERPSKRNNWGYNQTLGLGYYEYFLFCEDIGTNPLPVLPAAYDPHHQRLAPFEQLDEWIFDALDLIEFANGDENTTWGKIRCDLGHKKPFGLKYIGIGNEEVGEGFFERYPYFHRAIKERYPEIKVIASSGPFAHGGEYEKGWDCAKKNNADLVDEHYYMAPEWFLANQDRYDSYLNTEPKVFLGEYASWGNTWYNALVEASFMIGLERNSHAVSLACYAPLLCNVNYINWKPNLIWFNNYQVFGTANYYVQKLFMNHQGDIKLDFSLETDLPKTDIFDNPIGGYGVRPQPSTTVIYKNFVIEDLEAFKVEKYEDDIFLSSDKQQLILGELVSNHYIIKTKAIMKSGNRGFKIQVGRKDNDNKYCWEIGGWQNMDSTITQDINGRNTCITQSSYTIELDKEYELILEVNNRHFYAYINGELIHDVYHKPIIIEPIYFSATKEVFTEDVILKLVNINSSPVDADISIEGMEGNKAGILYSIYGYELDEENSFEEPKKIIPKEEKISIKQGHILKKIPKQSVSIIRIKDEN